MKLTFSRIILVSNKKATAPTTTTTTTTAATAAAAATQSAKEDSKRIFKTLSSHSTQQTNSTSTGVGTGTGTGTGTISTDNNSNSKDVHTSVLASHTLSPIYSASMSEYASQASSKNGSPRGSKKKGVGSSLRIEVNAATHESTDTADDHLPRRYTILYYAILLILFLFTGYFL